MFDPAVAIFHKLCRIQLAEGRASRKGDRPLLNYLEKQWATVYEQFGAITATTSRGAGLKLMDLGQVLNGSVDPLTPWADDLRLIGKRLRRGKQRPDDIRTLRSLLDLARAMDSVHWLVEALETALPGATRPALVATTQH